MPSYFRTSARQQGAAKRDRQAAVLRDLEQVGGRGRSEWREGAVVGSQHFTERVNKKARGHKFNSETPDERIRTGRDAVL